MLLELTKIGIARHLLSTGLDTAGGAAIGGIIGAARKKDKKESRLHSIGRGAATGAATGLGINAGMNLARVGAKKALLPKIEKAIGEGNHSKVDTYSKLGLAAISTGGAVGGLTAYKLSKRKDK